MIAVERQVHGYSQGHQLLASSAPLPKADQALIDRLSDVAGPLRPREKFAPYLTAYPLPSGERYVLARTWQDTEVARAGCVRTLSLVISSKDWSTAPNPAVLLDLLEISGGLPAETDATTTAADSASREWLPPTLNFRASDLLEALFLEETKPVVVFDAPEPDLIAVRLLTALWPSLRRRFALSTFALSPRKISGRDFDLVFAPKDARAKFADWPGRKVDGRSTQDGRHKWTSHIVHRVFDQPHPQLLTEAELGLVGSDDESTSAALRIALLWDELSNKLPTTPTAALGLLDIANSGKVRDDSALGSLEPSLAVAIREASIKFPSADAWDFLGAIMRKMQGRSMPNGWRALKENVELLASRAPEGGIALLGQPDLKGAVANLTGSISNGIAKSPASLGNQTLLAAPAPVFGRLIAEGQPLADRVSDDPSLVLRLAEVLSGLEDPLFQAVSDRVLPRLSEDWQFPAAQPLLSKLDRKELAEEALRLGTTNDFAGDRIGAFIVERSRQIGGREALRDAIATLPPTSRRDAMVSATLDADPSDVSWLLALANSEPHSASQLLLNLLRRAADADLGRILDTPGAGAKVLELLGAAGADVLHRAIFAAHLPLAAFVRSVNLALSSAAPTLRTQIVEHALTRCLQEHLEGDAISTLASWLGILGSSLNGVWAVRTGLARDVTAVIASRNMIAFESAPAAARTKIVGAVAEMADVLYDRRAFDLDAAAIRACAHLMEEAERTAHNVLLKAAGRLLPTLIRQTRAPVSPLIAVLFPAVYRELAKEDEVPDLLKIVPFFDWDRCKAARHELVAAFMSSAWPAADLALSACRCNDVGRILRRTAKAYGGESYIARIGTDLQLLPETCRQATSKALSALKVDWPARYDWRD